MKQVVSGAAMASFLIAMLPGAPALAATPGDVRDLVGARASAGESALESRGYTFQHGSTGDDRKWTYWWNRDKKQCLSVSTVDGRYDAITSTPAADCGQKGGGGDTAAAVAVGAAALIGVIALAHKSHNHDDGQHYSDSQSEADYERGYRDGLYNQSYHNYSRSDAYANGYSAGVEQRNQETAYRPNHPRGGYGDYVNLSDISYQDWDRAQSELSRRGFRQVDRDSNSDGGHTAYYWNGGTSQCVAIATRSGRATDVTTVRKRVCS
ncbi:MAG: hypothetical protein QHC65_06675 [Sphingomonas sp.]|nr:hypothetical protein [Sphingomonas sp.]MDX3884088.1 hypothetical protein [Sphingomonas sp.]